MKISAVCGTLEETLSGRSVPFFAKEGKGKREKGKREGRTQAHLLKAPLGAVGVALWVWLFSSFSTLCLPPLGTSPRVGGRALI